MKRTLAILAAALTLGASSIAASAACTTSTPVDVPTLMDAITAIDNGGAGNGTYSFNGTADCPTAPAFDPSEALAVGAALSTPVWLGEGENFAISGGLGFSDSDTALGATGVLRIGKNLAGFAGGAVSTGGDVWAGKVGVRAGF